VWSIARDAGVIAAVNAGACAAAFLDWIETISAQQSAARLDRRDYIVFSAGMLLRFLLSERVIEVDDFPENARCGGHDERSQAWPQCYVAVSYCLAVLDGVLRQERLPALSLPSNADDARFWSSFGENCEESPILVIPFIDALVGAIRIGRIPCSPRRGPRCTRPAELKSGRSAPLANGRDQIASCATAVSTHSTHPL